MKCFECILQTETEKRMLHPCDIHIPPSIDKGTLLYYILSQCHCYTVASHIFFILHSILMPFLYSCITYC